MERDRAETTIQLTRRGYRGLFVVGAAASAIVPHSTGRWVPLHLYLAGGLVLAISGASVLFTVTWSAARPPADGWLRAQQVATALGAAGLVPARALDAPVAVFVAAGACSPPDCSCWAATIGTPNLTAARCRQTTVDNRR